jgi:isopentenyl-diphosphate delta-isomerase
MSEDRKREHVEIYLNRNVLSHHNYWDDIILLHNALPEVNKQKVKMQVNLFGKKLQYPLVVSGMTGGFKGAYEINKNLAIACERFGIGMGVGSQRSGLDNHGLRNTYEVITEYNVPVKIANIGLPQLTEEKEEALAIVSKCIDMISADAIALHLNFLQEATQPEGSTLAEGCLDLIKKISREISTPVIVKETGAGISSEVASALADTDIACLDVGGLSGTSFSAIESYRAGNIGDTVRERVGQTFWDWGIPTPASILEVKKVFKGRKIIATGGLRNGLDAAKAIALGADIGGIAGSLLKEASASAERVKRSMEIITEELRTACFLCGCSSVENLKNIRWVWGKDGWRTS